MHYLIILTIILKLWYFEAIATASTYCPEIKPKAKQVAITKIRAILMPTDTVSIYKPWKSKINSHKLTEKMMKYEVVTKCCAGYSISSSGMCEPIYKTRHCGEFEECIEPNICRCKRGYTAALDSVNATCLPTCAEDCADQHAHCQAPNICACDVGYVASKTNTTGGMRCQRRCRVGVVWDPVTLTCVERQEVNVTVIAAEMDLLVPDLKVRQVEDIEGGGDGQLDAFVGAKNTARTTTAAEIPEPKTSGCLTLVNALIGLGVTILLLTFAAVALYILKRRQHNDGHVILEGEYFIDRSQILVY